MGTTLTGTTPQDTYDSLIKVTDNGPLTGSLKKLTDGLGNDSSLSLSTTAASLSGTLAVSGAFTGTSANIINTGGNSLLVQNGAAGATSGIIIQQVGTEVGRISFPSSTTMTFSVGASVTTAMVITSAGNVGIGTSAPATNKILHLNNGSGAFIRMSMTNTATGVLDTDGLSFQVENSKAIIKNQENEDLVLGANNSETQLVLKAGGTIEVGAGIKFPATQVSSADSNTLDDYEEGTWTIGVSFDNSSVALTTSSNTGTYTKIGRQVTVNGFIVLTNKGSSSGAARITGLPFTIPNSNSNFAAGSLRLENITFANQFQSFGDINTTSIRLQEITEAGAVDNILDTDFANNSAIMVSFTYFV